MRPGVTASRNDFFPVAYHNSGWNRASKLQRIFHIAYPHHNSTLSQAIDNGFSSNLCALLVRCIADFYCREHLLWGGPVDLVDVLPIAKRHAKKHPETLLFGARVFTRNAISVTMPTGLRYMTTEKNF